MRRLIDPNFPEFGNRFDTDRATFTIFQAAMLWDGKEPAEDGVFREDPLLRLKLGGEKHDPYQRVRSVYEALIGAVKSGEFSVIPMCTKDGAIDGLKTELSREQLRAWAEKRGEAPAFLFPPHDLIPDWKSREASSPGQPTGLSAGVGNTLHGDFARKPAPPVQRFAAQEAAILAAIESAGYRPQALPKPPAGKAGVKAKVRDALGAQRLFTGAKIFDAAWERLRKRRDIRDAD